MEANKLFVSFLFIISFHFISCSHSGKINKSKSRESLNHPNFKNNNKKIHSYRDTAQVGDENKVIDPQISERDLLFFELAGAEYKNLSETKLYSKSIEQYQKSDLKGVEAYRNLLILKYPKSKVADSVLYYEGMLALELKNFGHSLECFQKIISLFPQSNKAVSAMFAKSIVYKKLNLKTESEKVLTEIQNKYPGSPESLRAKNELSTAQK